MNILNKGLNGYSLQGPKGKAGEKGNSVFFCAYDIEDHLQTVIDIISTNGTLSNNVNVQYKEKVEYKNGDIIIDKVGGIYELSSLPYNYILTLKQNIFN